MDIGNLIPIYNGSTFVPTSFSELTNTTSNASVNPAAVTTNACYDLFVWNNAGTVNARKADATADSVALQTVGA